MEISKATRDRISVVLRLNSAEFEMAARKNSNLRENSDAAIEKNRKAAKELGIQNHESFVEFIL